MFFKINKIFLTLFCLTVYPLLFAQEQGKIIDQVLAVVGGHIILESDIEAQYMQYRMQEEITGSSSTVKCEMLESMLYQKLLLNQAELDSVEVTDSQVEATWTRGSGTILDYLVPLKNLKNTIKKPLKNLRMNSGSRLKSYCWLKVFRKK